MKKNKEIKEIPAGNNNEDKNSNLPIQKHYTGSDTLPSNPQTSSEDKLSAKAIAESNTACAMEFVRKRFENINQEGKSQDGISSSFAEQDPQKLKEFFRERVFGTSKELDKDTIETLRKALERDPQSSRELISQQIDEATARWDSATAEILPDKKIFDALGEQDETFKELSLDLEVTYSSLSPQDVFLACKKQKEIEEKVNKDQHELLTRFTEIRSLDNWSLENINFLRQKANACKDGAEKLEKLTKQKLASEVKRIEEKEKMIENIIKSIKNQNDAENIKKYTNQAKASVKWLNEKIKLCGNYKDLYLENLIQSSSKVRQDFRNKRAEAINIAKKKPDYYNSPLTDLPTYIEKFHEIEQDFVNFMKPDNKTLHVSNIIDPIFNKIKMYGDSTAGTALINLEIKYSFTEVEKLYIAKRQEAFRAFDTQPAFNEFLKSSLRLCQFALLVNKNWFIPQLTEQVGKLEAVIRKSSGLNNPTGETQNARDTLQSQSLRIEELLVQLNQLDDKK